MSGRISTGCKLALAGSLLLSGVELASAQQQRIRGGGRMNRDERGRFQSRTTTDAQTNQILRTSLIVGAAVNLQGGGSFGQVQDVVINDSGCVDYVVVSYNNRYVPVPWAAAMYQPANRVILLDINRSQIAQIPTYTQISELSNAQFKQKVQTFYRGHEHGQRDNRPVPDVQNGQPHLRTDAQRGNSEAKQNDGQPAAGQGNQPTTDDNKPNTATKPAR